MPQMSPLPWVSLMVMVLGLTVVYMVLVNFLISKTLNEKGTEVGKVRYSWKW